MTFRQTRVVNGKKVPTGSLMIDKRFRGIGRVKVASGTLNKATYNAYLTALNDLYASGQFDPILALKEKRTVGTEGTVTPKMVYDWWRDRSKPVPWSKDNVNAFDSLNAFIESAGGDRRLADTTRRTYAKRLNVLETKFGISKLSLRELPEVLEKYQRECESKQPPQEAAFRNTRALLQGCIGDVLGSDSAAYKAVVKLGLVRTRGLIKKVKQNPFTPSELDAALKACDDTVFSDIVWFMCCVGCGPKEFFEDGWEFESDKVIRVYGNKNKRRFNRPVPVVFQGLRPNPAALGKRMFSKKFQQVFPTHTPYDLRRTFQTWCLKAGVDRMHFKVYSGHALSISEHYTEEDVNRWIDKDRVLLADYIGKKRSEVDDFDYQELQLPEHPTQIENNLHEKKLSFFLGKINSYLASLHLNGQMRKLYKVDYLAEVKTDKKNGEKN